MPYVQAFEQMGFGMFIHWGLYSQLGQGEWIYNRAFSGDMERYSRLKETFTAKDFDAAAYAKLAKEAGCKYIVLTTRHHEGFSLYDTCGLTDYDAPHIIGRDLVREYVDACREYGIVPFFYHTTLDWYQKSFTEDFDSYLEYLRASVEVLCKNYGPIGGLWFDGNWSKKDADWKEDELYATIRKYQKEAIIVNNTGLHKRGMLGNPEIDSVTFERGRPTPMDREGMPKYVAAEMCETTNDHWGYGKWDINYKSPKQLIETLCHCRKVGANLLLNIGPMEHGAIDPMQDALLHCIGKWMQRFGEAIYNGRPCGILSDSESFVLKGPDALYFFVFDLPRNGDSNVTLADGEQAELHFSGLTGSVSRIEWMDSGKELEFSQDGDKLSMLPSGWSYGSSGCVRVAKATLA